MDGNLREENGITIRRVLEIVKRNFFLMSVVFDSFFGVVISLAVFSHSE